MTNLNSAIKAIIRDYLKNEGLCDLVYGTYTGSGLKIDNKPVAIPADMVDIPKTLKDAAEPLRSGDRVAVIQKQGNQRYYILDRL